MAHKINVFSIGRFNSRAKNLKMNKLLDVQFNLLIRMNKLVILIIEF